MCLPNILSPVFMFAFIFHCPSFSPCWPLAFLIVSPPLWIFMFFFLQNSSLLFSITRSSSFSVIHVSVNIKNDVEKDTTLLLFFLSQSPGGHAISFQIIPWVAFCLPYLLIELFYIWYLWCGRTLGRSVGRCTVTWLPHILTHGSVIQVKLEMKNMFFSPSIFLVIFAYNHGRKSWDTLAFLGRFPVHTGPTPPLTPQTMLDACIQNFFQVSTLYRVGEGRTARKFRKGCTGLRGNREMTEKYEYCCTVPRTFVQDCRY